MKADRKGFLSVKEASVHYEVSRAKLHRLIQLGSLRTERDPRDERVTLLRADELEALFRFPSEEVEEMGYNTRTTDVGKAAGRLTAELRARVDALRTRVAGGRTLASDSAAIIREERERRGRQIYAGAFGANTHRRLPEVSRDGRSRRQRRAPVGHPGARHRGRSSPVGPLARVGRVADRTPAIQPLRWPTPSIRWCVGSASAAPTHPTSSTC